MPLPKHLAKVNFLIPGVTGLAVILIGLVFPLFRNTIALFYTLIVSMILIVIVALVSLFQILSADRLYRKTILKQPLISFQLSPLQVNEALSYYHHGYRQMMKHNLIALVPSFILAMLMFSFLNMSGDPIVGILIGSCFLYLGVSTYLSRRLQYLPPDPTNPIVVLGVDGLYLFGRFHYWTPQGFWLKSVRLEEATSTQDGRLVLQYSVFNGLLVSLVTLTIPVSYENQEPLKKQLDRLPMTVN